MKWSAVAASEPALGAVVFDRLIGPGVLFAGTVRRDGSPRISGLEPLVMDEDLWLSMMPASAKARDLARDRRILLHSIVTGPEPAAEVKVRGTAQAEPDRDVQRRYAAAVSAGIGWRPVVGEFTLFAVDIEDVTYIGYDADTRGQHVARWPAGVEYVRPQVTPTSLGPPHPVRRLLT
jgi:Pyridoxamine 5'-phosphate oxidase